MRFSSMITSIEAHAAGCPLRVITGGFPRIPGSTMPQKVQYMKRHLDHLRTMLIHEPRGHSGMCAAVLTEPTDPGADYGFIILEPQGYVPMCGHCVIAASTVLVEAGMVEVKEPVTTITLDALAGLIEATVRVESGRAKEVTLRNVPAFSYLTDVEVKTEEFGTVTMDVAYGGMFYLIIEAKQVGLTLQPGELGKIISAGMSILRDAKEQVEIAHPGVSRDDQLFFGGTAQVQFYGPPTQPGASVRNVVVVPPSDIDRSPCGTGTCARMANLYAKGKLKAGEQFIHESYIGTLFKGKIVGETKVGGYPAIIPELTGNAFVTALHQFVVDPEDPLKDGYLLR